MGLTLLVLGCLGSSSGGLGDGSVGFGLWRLDRGSSRSDHVRQPLGADQDPGTPSIPRSITLPAGQSGGLGGGRSVEGDRPLRRRGASRRGRRRPRVGCGAGSLVGGGAAVLRVVLGLPQARSTAGRRDQARDAKLVEWLRANTDLSARILFEDQLRLLEWTDAESVHWTPLMPDLLGADSRMFIGGLYQTAFIKHHEWPHSATSSLATVRSTSGAPRSGRLLPNLQRGLGGLLVAAVLVLVRPVRVGEAGRDAASLLDAGLPPSDNEHERVAIIRRAGRGCPFRYMLEAGRGLRDLPGRAASFILPSGQRRIVSVAPNRVELADVEPEGGAVVVSLHWIDTWRTEPPLTLRPSPCRPTRWTSSGSRCRKP